MLFQKTHLEGELSAEEVQEFLASALAAAALAGQRVLALIPDATRTAPVPLLFRTLAELLGPQAAELHFLIALGTHPPMPEEARNKLLGLAPGELNAKYPKIKVYNHLWQDEHSLTTLGIISAQEMEELSGGLLKLPVSVVVNKLILEYDCLLLVGPVFPHEVAGFSGGHKYFFPGVSSADMINVSHWLGAVITTPRIIGRWGTPVRAMFDRAAEMVPTPRYGLSMVMRGEALAGIYFGDVKTAWAEATVLSDRLHIVYKAQPYRSVLSCAPEMYEDIWTAGKCMYKLENVVADGGELLIYAPHVKEFSYTHGEVLEEVGYHTRDYFLQQWNRFQKYPWVALAHSTRVRGIGNYEKGEERPRIQVTLATGISEERCRRANLGYRDPASIRSEEWQGREEEGILYVPRAGEMLYRLEHPPAWACPLPRHHPR